MPVSLADAAVQTFLHSKEVVILATVQKDGAPLAMPMWFVAGPDALYMISEATTQKVRNLHRDARVCVVAETGTRGAEVCGVTIQGHVVFLQQAAAIQPVVDRLLRKYDPHLATLWGGSVFPPNRVMVRIVPEKVHSWGF